MAEGQEPAGDSGGGGSEAGQALQMLIAQQSKSLSESFVEFSELEKPEDGKNQKILICVHCRCKVMKPGYGRLVEKEVRMTVCVGILSALTQWVSGLGLYPSFSLTDLSLLCLL